MLNQYEINSTVTVVCTFRDSNGNLVNPTTVTALITLPDQTTFVPVTINNPSVGEYNFDYTPTVEGEFTYSFLGVIPSSNTSQRESGSFSVIYYNDSQLDYLIPLLRLRLGDSETLNYSTDYLRQALILAVKALSPRWRNRYYYDAGGILRRGTDFQTFLVSDPPIIQPADEWPIILQASIIIKGSELKQVSITSSALNFVGSWRDDEISFSNIQGGTMLQASLERDIQELDEILPPRANKLAKTIKQSLPGFTLNQGNYYEG